MHIKNLALVLFIGIFIVGIGCTNTAPEGGQDQPDTSSGQDDAASDETADVETPVIDTSDSGEVPEAWPADLTFPDGYDVTLVVDTSNPMTDMINLTIEGHMTMEELADYYKNIDGWEIDTSEEEEIRTNFHYFKIKSLDRREHAGINISDKQTHVEVTIMFVRFLDM